MKRTMLLFFAALVCCTAARAQEEQPIIRFGIIADIQYADRESSIGRFYRSSLGKLDECVLDLNDEQVDFTVVLGDLIDRDPESFNPVLARLDRLSAPVYNTTGNHDYCKEIPNETIYRMLGMPSSYYSFDRAGWVFVMLNTNEIASYSAPKGRKQKELDAIIKEGRDEGRENVASYNGAVGRKQMRWLEKTLKKAQKRGEKVMILSHHPLYPENKFEALDNRAVLELISGYPCVKVLFSGHHHKGDRGFYHDIPAVTVQGMVESAYDNAYGIVEVYSNKVLLKGQGRMTSRELIITP